MMGRQKIFSNSNESMTMNTIHLFVVYALSKSARDNLITALDSEFF